MHLVPETRSGKIDFYQTRLPAWAADPSSIGLSADSVDQLQAMVETARAAFNEHSLAQQTARAATLKFYDAVRRMHAGGDGVMGGASMLQTIKTYATTTGDADVYARATITPPAKPGVAGSAPVPGTPYRFAVDLRQSGELLLTWKCDNPDGTVGTIYQVKRRVDDGSMVLVGTVGEKKFLDRAVPPGSKYCIYEVTAMRSTGKGETGQHLIQFGCANLNPSVEVKSRKLAA